MSDIPFHDTRMGRTFHERHVPAIVEALQQIAAELKRLNDALAERGGERRDPPQPD